MRSQEYLFHIEKWLKEKEQRLYSPIGSVDFTYMLVNQWLPYEEAIQGSFGPVQPGTEWGKSSHYGWFKSTVILTPESAGKRVELQLNIGGESTIYVNGRLAGASDLQHSGVMLTQKAEAGDVFEILAEVYAGHDRALPIYGESKVVIVQEELYQFYIDLQTLLQLRNALEPSSLRVSEIDKGFRKLIATLDWSTNEEGLQLLAEQGRLILKPLLACVNGSTAPKLYMMGQSHLDIAWLWPIEETKRKIARTLSNQMALLEQYPEYTYVQSQPYLFQMVKDLYPELYGRLKFYVAEGRIIPEGGMWVEPDTNIPSGESLVRQFLYGKAFFREQFGVENEMLWLPDVFGYSGNLPQIMRKSGIRYFASVKMYQTYDNVADPFPYNTFTWEGIDGSEVSVHLLDYGPFPNPTDAAYVHLQWNERIQKQDISTRLVQFGYGDGGGGANRDDLESLRRMGNLEGLPQTVIASPIDYFEDLQQRGMPDSHYVGELYYPAHRGTFTTQAKMKKGNRAGEFALRDAELWSAVAAKQHGHRYAKEALAETWRKLLLLQFHDILPGTSITRVHVEAEKAFTMVLEEARSMARGALQTLVAPHREGVTLFNSLAWERSALVELPSNMASDQKLLSSQVHDNKTYVKVQLPAMGYTDLNTASVSAEFLNNELAATPTSLENQWLKLTLNTFGEITSLIDKETGEEWLGGRSNQFLMYRDQTSNYDAWEIDRRYADSAIELHEPARITVLAEGPLFASILVERTLNQSTLTQEIRLEAGSRRVDFRTKILWKEKHKLLKVGFHVNLHSQEVLSEIQFGYVKRPNHFSRIHDADRYEVNQHKWSAFVEGDRCFSLLNDSKYGMNASGKHMNLTLLRGATYPDERADEGVHEFTYAMHIWHKGFMSDPVIQEAYELNSPIIIAAGSAQQSFRLAHCDRKNIIIDTIKLAEDGSGDWILRAYESKGATTRCSLTLGVDFKRAIETNMLEEPIDHVSIDRIDASTLSLSFTPFEVKTIRMS
ncbi:alpha-mannosidase [Paenibacillus pectinilyticus]|uniref:Alpha-mannosidase n=1 Tax=Paenibacillus pectinilyticus TaxID=512399 RepID=A0A1C0ZXS7_9BACL|nr:glycoside hydrolase family 38 C-terminal domain-containing protein [Paenibacillus pectinilyticus]OCT12935.1 alpha-mannosidase [Paenibacillus pectinilyticus]